MTSQSEQQSMQEPAGWDSLMKRLLGKTQRNRRIIIIMLISWGFNHYWFNFAKLDILPEQFKSWAWQQHCCLTSHEFRVRTLFPLFVCVCIWSLCVLPMWSKSPLDIPVDSQTPKTRSWYLTVRMCSVMSRYIILGEPQPCAPCSPDLGG